MNRSALRYKGYDVAPDAQRLPNGLFAANLTIGKAASGHRYDAHSFDALDYFFDEEHALAYACRWGRLWIDNRHKPHKQSQ
ncbi:transcriptional regulator [Paraburkholderia sp.]|uniref:transcriptional regulator n=1 Tax=Paraburkholderia sp. TaxID=1926495 RepID=UPI00239391DD|nr:transcriptional regulator [Paraburkholderia sp.]MDE1182583.1 transcriptional regulator [Paraburkholderia sp.]